MEGGSKYDGEVQEEEQLIERDEDEEEDILQSYHNTTGQTKINDPNALKLDPKKQQSDLVADPQINQQTLIYSNKVKIDDIVINKQKMSSDALNDGTEEAFES